MKSLHCVKRIPIRSFSGPCFPAFALNTPYSVLMLGNTDQKNSEYRHFSRSFDSVTCYFIHESRKWCFNALHPNQGPIIILQGSLKGCVYSHWSMFWLKNTWKIVVVDFLCTCVIFFLTLLTEIVFCTYALTSSRM